MKENGHEFKSIGGGDLINPLIMKNFPCNILIKLVILLLPTIASCSSHNYSEHHQFQCGKSFTNNNLKQDYISNTLSNLIAKAPPHGYAISSFGIGYDAIYGLVQCREDVDNITCSSCITNAVNQIRILCPSSSEARIWYEYCFLHYDAYNFIGQPDTSYAYVWPSKLVISDSEEIDVTIGQLLDAAKASAVGKDVKQGLIESHEKKHNITFFATAQCTLDLHESACSYCLEKALEVMSEYCNYHLGCHYISTSCLFKYDTYDFFDIDFVAVASSNAAAATTYITHFNDSR